MQFDLQSLRLLGIVKCTSDIGPVKHFLKRKLRLFSYPSVLTCVLDAQKNRLIESPSP